MHRITKILISKHFNSYTWEKFVLTALKPYKFVSQTEMDNTIKHRLFL